MHRTSHTVPKAPWPSFLSTSHCCGVEKSGEAFNFLQAFSEVSDDSCENFRFFGDAWLGELSFAFLQARREPSSTSSSVSFRFFEEESSGCGSGEELSPEVAEEDVGVLSQTCPVEPRRTGVADPKAPWLSFLRSSNCSEVEKSSELLDFLHAVCEDSDDSSGKFRLRALIILFPVAEDKNNTTILPCVSANAAKWGGERGLLVFFLSFLFRVSLLSFLPFLLFLLFLLLFVLLLLLFVVFLLLFLSFPP